MRQKTKGGRLYTRNARRILKQVSLGILKN